MFFPPFVVLGVWLYFSVCFILRCVVKLQLRACMWGAFKSSFRNLQAMQSLPNASPKYRGPVKSNTACVCVRVGGWGVHVWGGWCGVWDNVRMKSNPDDWQYGLFRNLTHTFIMAFSLHWCVCVFFLGGRGGGVQMRIGLIEWCLLRINKLGS